MTRVPSLARKLLNATGMAKITNERQSPSALSRPRHGTRKKPDKSGSTDTNKGHRSPARKPVCSRGQADKKQRQREARFQAGPTPLCSPGQDQGEQQTHRNRAPTRPPRQFGGRTWTVSGPGPPVLPGLWREAGEQSAQSPGKLCVSRQVVTFDAGGVSGHSNHVALYAAAR